MVCADPESFVRGVQLSRVFLVSEGREDPNTNISGPSPARQRNAIQMAFRWRADDGPLLNAGMAIYITKRGPSTKPHN